jgi:HAD superfamily hydrolase (TIGR01509 family)
MSERLLIFDCDGVLVDSEPIALAVLLEVVAEAGYRLDEALAYRHLLGKSREQEERLLREEFGLAIEPELLHRELPQRLDRRLQRELKPVPGVVQTLAHLGGARCVASSSRMERIRLSLSVTGLLEAFEPHLFSASSVMNGKPAPDLFLHAASTMAYKPQDCVVVEDSPAGIRAAQRAGMNVYAFLGGSHAGPAGLAQAVAALNPDAIFDDMRKLPGLISALDSSRCGKPHPTDNR